MIRIIIEWKKSRAYGHTPKATLITKCNRYSDKVSGYGYDKESAVVARVLNHVLNNSQEPFKLSAEMVFSYGVELRGFETGGVGVDCFKVFFEANGYTWQQFGTEDTTVIIITGEGC